MGDFAAVGGVLVAAIGFAFGLYQYAIAQRWKKSEFAARQLERLRTEPLLRFCCKVLDYSSRTMTVPEPHRHLSAETTFRHDLQVLGEAVRHEHGVDDFPWPQVVYRDAFDEFFDYLERINHYVERSLITTGDVAPLGYWLEEIARPRFGAESQQASPFTGYLIGYDYSGVLRLFDKFGIERPPGAS